MGTRQTSWFSASSKGGKLRYSEKAMKNLLFQAAAQVSAFFIRTNLRVVTTVNGWIGRLAYAVMVMIDKKRLAVYEQVAANESFGPSELTIQQTELNLLNSASQVRDHAKETGDWTEQHTRAINAIAESLVLEFGWDEDQVNRYLKEVVESIDGLQFGLEDW